MRGPGAVRVRLFFFSSRRRHTRYWRDWSSDVCSSDLETRECPCQPLRQRHAARANADEHDAVELWVVLDDLVRQPQCEALELHGVEQLRSEERRVGKECRCRGSPSQYRKKSERWVEM